MVCCFLSHARLSQTPCRLVSGFLRPRWTDEALGGVVKATTEPTGSPSDNGLIVRSNFSLCPSRNICGIHFGDEDECQRIRRTAKAPATRRCLSIPQSGGRT